VKNLRGVQDTMNWVDFGRRSYELRAGGDIVATLRWPTRFGSAAQGETAEGRVTVERAGLLRPRVVLSDDTDSSRDASPPGRIPVRLTLELDFGGRGVVRVRDEASASLQWLPTNFWRTAWAFEHSAQGRSRRVLSFEFDSALPRFEHKVRVEDPEAPDLGALVLLGSAVGLMLTEDAAPFSV
jgi:hypothetical protein